MRDIKFRAWDKANNEIYQVRTLTWDRWENVAEGQDDIMQYTGLKDKNGVEIYENDICSYKEFGGSLSLYRRRLSLAQYLLILFPLFENYCS